LVIVDGGVCWRVHDVDATTSLLRLSYFSLLSFSLSLVINFRLKC
jgi:hypothetical protein